MENVFLNYPFYPFLSGTLVKTEDFYSYILDVCKIYRIRPYSIVYAIHLGRMNVI